MTTFLMWLCQKEQLLKQVCVVTNSVSPFVVQQTASHHNLAQLDNKILICACIKKFYYCKGGVIFMSVYLSVYLFLRRITQILMVEISLTKSADGLQPH